mgnify:CR=1 FL=1
MTFCRVSVRVLRDRTDDATGKEVAVLCDGQCFGEIAMVVPEQKRTAFIVALTFVACGEQQ